MNVGAIKSAIKSNLGKIGLGAGSAAVGAGLGFVAGRASSRRKSRTRKRTRSKTRKSRTYKRVRRTPRTAGKRQDTSHRRIRYTKNGQPYVILRSGKARFIKKRGARSSHRRKGGRY